MLAGLARPVTRAGEVATTIRLKTNKVVMTKPRITHRFFNNSWLYVGKRPIFAAVNMTF